MLSNRVGNVYGNQNVFLWRIGVVVETFLWVDTVWFRKKDYRHEFQRKFSSLHKGTMFEDSMGGRLFFYI